LLIIVQNNVEQKAPSSIQSCYETSNLWCSHCITVEKASLSPVDAHFIPGTLAWPLGSNLCCILICVCELMQYECDCGCECNIKKNVDARQHNQSTCALIQRLLWNSTIEGSHKHSGTLKTDADHKACQISVTTLLRQRGYATVPLLTWSTRAFTSAWLLHLNLRAKQLQVERRYPTAGDILRVASDASARTHIHLPINIPLSTNIMVLSVEKNNESSF